MTRSEDISERFWSSPQKAEEEGRRERWFLDDVIQKAHLDHEIRSRLAGVRSILDAGGGTGRFSIPLAREGFDVTHLDVSPSMIDAARERARREGVESRMSFERARLGDLAGYPSHRFDLPTRRPGRNGA
jgi:2-polyprenyl-3-methyl-5-hydroxy-6-metoxy-1,4-benzoquinol methylase